MPGKNRTPLIGWHPADPALKPWLEGEATRRGVPVSRLLDEALEAYRHLLATEDAGQAVT
jgi:hypothetical protein